MDNPVFVHNEDIPHIDDEEDYDDNSRYDTPNTSRIEKMSFTEQSADMLKREQRQRLVRDYIEDLYTDI